MSRIPGVNDWKTPGSAADGNTSDERFLKFKKVLHQQLIASMDLAAIGTMSDEERKEVRKGEQLSRQMPGR